MIYPVQCLTDLKLGARTRCLASVLCSVFGLGTQAAFAQDATPVNAGSDAEEAELAPMCKTDLRLSGAVYNATRPERSFAMFETEASHNGWVYRVGARIGGFELIEVAPRGALLRGPDGECWLQLLGDASGVGAHAPTPRAKRAKRTDKRPKNAKKSEVVVIGSRSH